MNAEKCNAMILAKEKLPENFILNIGDISLSPENQVTLLGITFDSKLNFEAHIQTLCKEVPKKVNSFLRIASYLNVAESTDEFRFFYSQLTTAYWYGCLLAKRQIILLINCTKGASSYAQ